MKRLKIKNSGFCNVVFGENIVGKIGEFIRNILAVDEFVKLVVVSDYGVYSLYGEKLKRVLEKACFKVYIFKIAPGESSKNIANLTNLYDFLLDNKVNKNDYILAFGGGVVGDLAGFAAASFFRGIGFIQIPTTLLSQVDSSIGGKSAINLKRGKNIVGFIKQPDLVVCDLKFLNSLSPYDFRSGISEVIKYSVIFSKKMFRLIENSKSFFDILPAVVYKCILFKKKVVEVDEFEENLRIKLNFGHTVAHALETHFEFEKLSHGEALSIGMSYALNKFEKIGAAKSGECNRLMAVLKRFKLPVKTDVSDDIIFEKSLADKKFIGNFFNLVIVPKIGNSYVLDLTFEEYRKFFLG